MIGTIGLGSSLGDRQDHLRHGLRGLEAAGLELEAVSSVWEAEPVASGADLWFLNMAVRVRSDISPRALLRALQFIEDEAGRLRCRPNGPRTLDLDLLTLGDVRSNDPGLQLPHPRMWQRRFVLAPLAEIAPELRNPATGRNAAEELERLDDNAVVVRLGALPRGSSRRAAILARGSLHR